MAETESLLAMVESDVTESLTANDCWCCEWNSELALILAQIDAMVRRVTINFLFMDLFVVSYVFY